jgi:hypothetical protein
MAHLPALHGASAFLASRIRPALPRGYALPYLAHSHGLFSRIRLRFLGHPPCLA